MKVGVIIPIYKEQLSKSEQISFLKCCSVLDKHPIILIAPHNLDVSVHENFCGTKLNIIRFDDHFFKNIDGYNKLLLAEAFYLCFKDYDYMLVYQLDAYVFNDELNFWCEKNYSYIGAPWFENFDINGANTQLWAVGNGGFSLRKISDFMDVFAYRGKVFSFSFLWQKYSAYSMLGKMLRFPKIAFLYFFKNNTQNLYELFGENEDHFWSFHAARLSNKFNVAPVSEALAFAFECNPQKMYELNKRQLPFGVHAWEKYGKEFWLNYVPENVL
jgi:hypothetical protein